MDPQTQHASLSRVLALAAKQHGLVTRAQLLGLGMSADAIKYRVRRGRLHPVQRGVYAVGRPQLTRLGTLLAAVLSCGPQAALSHHAAAEVLGIRRRRDGPVDVTVPGAQRKRPGLRSHRSALPPGDCAERQGVPVTGVTRTLVDLASTRISDDGLEAAINEADRLDLIDPERLRAAVARMPKRSGTGRLNHLLRDFTLTESQLERRFFVIVRKAGLPLPKTQQRVNGFRVDFWWPDHGLVVETDGLRYHRTPARQARDRRKDQAHVAAGLTSLRFTYAQVAYEPTKVQRILTETIKRAPRASPSTPPAA
jgi:very-short-patch-repair endonuclease